MSFGIQMGTFLLFAAFMMLLVVSVSAPVWSKVAFLMVEFEGGFIFRETIRAAYGNWGYCIWEDGIKKCSSSTVCGIIDGIDSTAWQYENTPAVVYGLSCTPVLHPIACFFAFLGFLAALGGRKSGLSIAYVVAWIATAITLIAGIFDWIMFATLYRQINGSDGPGGARFSSAMILVTISFVVLVLGSVTICVADPY